MRITTIESNAPYFGREQAMPDLGSWPPDLIEDLLGKGSVKRRNRLVRGRPGPKSPWRIALQRSVEVNGKVGNIEITGSEAVTGLRNRYPNVPLTLSTSNPKMGRLAALAFNLAGGSERATFYVGYDHSINVPKGVKLRSATTEGGITDIGRGEVVFGQLIPLPRQSRGPRYQQLTLIGSSMVVSARGANYAMAHSMAIEGLARSTGGLQDRDEVTVMMAAGYGLGKHEFQDSMGTGERDPLRAAHYLLDLIRESYPPNA